MRTSCRGMGAFALGLFVATTALARQAPRVEDPPVVRRPIPAIPKAADDPEKLRKVDELLEEWQRKSANVTRLDATFRRVNKDVIWKRTTEFEGRALLQSPNLACLDIKKVDPEDKTKKTFHERVICTGEEVVQYDGATQQIIVYPLPKEERQRALQEGPLPFLFDMKADDVKKRYRLVLMAEDSKKYRLQVIPLEDVDRDAFSQALVDLNKQTFLPDALQLHSPNGKETQTYLFTAVKTNAMIDPKNFQRVEIKGWKVVVNPQGQARPARGAGAGEEPRQPAMRPRQIPAR